MSKKTLTSLVAAASLAAAANAAEPPRTDTVTENTANSAVSIIASPKGITIPLGPDAAIGVKHSSVFGSSLDGRLVVGDMDAAIGVQGDVGSSANHLSLGVAKKAGPAVLSLTASGAREDATKALGNMSYDGVRLHGEQFGLGVDTTGVGPFKTVGGYVVSGRTHDAILDSSESTYTVDRTVNTGTSIDDYTDEFGVTTTKDYKGSKYTRTGVHGTANIGDNGELSLDLGRERNNLLGDKTVGGAKGTYYMGEHGKISAYVGTPTSGQHQVGVEYTLPLGSGWSLVPAYSATRGLIDEKRAMIQLVWTPGASKYFNRPSAEQALFAKNVVANNLSNPAHEIRNLGNYGKVETTVSSPVLKNSTLNSSTPFAPSCTADDTANTISCGSVDPATLEVSTNGGTSYSAFNAATTYAGAQTVLVRVKAQGTNPASPATTLNFTENYVVPMLPASLSDIGPVGDNGGIIAVSFAINMPVLNDINGNQIPYVVSGLPTTDGFGQAVTWSVSQTGATINISGVYAEGGIGGHTTTVPLSIISSGATGSTTVNVVIQAN